MCRLLTLVLIVAVVIIAIAIGLFYLAAGKTVVPDKTIVVLRHDLHSKLNREPRLDEVHFAYGQRLLDSGDTKGFFEHVEKAIRLKPNNTIYRFALARELAKEDYKKRALREIQTAARLSTKPGGDRTMASVYNEFAGELLMEMKRYDESERVLEKSLAQFSAYRTDIGSRVFNEATAAFYTETDEKAKALLDKARKELIHSRPTLEWIKTDMPWLKLESSPLSSKQAIEADKVIRKWSTELKRGFVYGIRYESPPHILLGRAYTTIGDARAAVIELLAAVEVSPKNSGAWYSLGWAYMVDGRLKQAAVAFREACRLGDAPSCVLAGKIEESWIRFRGI